MVRIHGEPIANLKNLKNISYDTFLINRVHEV